MKETNDRLLNAPLLNIGLALLGPTSNMIGREGIEAAKNGLRVRIKLRPSWRQSEIDVEKDFPEYNA